MNTHRNHRIDRDLTEELLRGAPAAMRRVGPLAASLAAARAPARPDELVGEQAAVAAFDGAARLDPVLQPRRTSMLKIALAKLLSAKAAAVVAATGASGVALAAGTGVLPNPLVELPAAPPASHAPATTPAPEPSHPATGRPAATPSASLVGLCRAYTAEVGANPGRALDNPAFTVLVTAAGGAEQVAEFCATLSATDGSPSRRGADPAGRPTAIPTPAIPTHAADAATDRPEPPARPASPGAPGATPAPRPGR